MLMLSPLLWTIEQRWPNRATAPSPFEALVCPRLCTRVSHGIRPAEFVESILLSVLSVVSERVSMATSIWTGQLTFGLVSLPVKLFSAARSETISFNLLHEKDHSRIRQVTYCQAEDKPVPRNELVKGYEYEKDQYVVIEDEEIKKKASDLAISALLLPGDQLSTTSTETVTVQFVDGSTLQVGPASRLGLSAIRSADGVAVFQLLNGSAAGRVRKSGSISSSGSTIVPKSTS